MPGAGDQRQLCPGDRSTELIRQTFNIEPSYRVKNAPDCPSGQFATGFEDAGTIKCAAPASSGGVRAFATTTDGVPLTGVTRVSAIAPPAGRYVVIATVELVNRDQDSESTALCRLTHSGGTIYQTGGHDLAGGDRESLSMTGWTFDHNGGEILLSCQEIFADVDVEVASLIAIRSTQSADPAAACSCGGLRQLPSAGRRRVFFGWASCGSAPPP